MDTARRLRRTPAAAFLLAVVLVPPAGGGLVGGGPAHAQGAGGPAAPPPARIGDVYDWRHHEPSQAEAQAREREDGVEPGARQQSSEAAEVDRLYQQLMGTSPTVPGPGESPASPGDAALGPNATGPAR